MTLIFLPEKRLVEIAVIPAQISTLFSFGVTNGVTMQKSRSKEF